MYVHSRMFIQLQSFSSPYLQGTQTATEPQAQSWWESSEALQGLQDALTQTKAIPCTKEYGSAALGFKDCPKGREVVSIASPGHQHRVTVTALSPGLNLLVLALHPMRTDCHPPTLLNSCPEPSWPNCFVPVRNAFSAKQDDWRAGQTLPAQRLYLCRSGERCTTHFSLTRIYAR